MRKDTQNWLASAEYDIETAKHMLATGRYLYVILMCHLALEKTLKAIAAEACQKAPPKTHDLLFLVDLGRVSPAQQHLDFLGKINNASIPTRYPEDLKQAIAAYPKQVAEDYLAQAQEVLAWLKLHPTLKRS